MKKSKRIAAVLLSAFMATSIISAFPASAATLENGTSSVTYNWEESFAWRGIHKIILPEGITIIGKYLYRFTDRNTTIKDVVISDGIVSISPEAFSNKQILQIYSK